MTNFEYWKKELEELVSKEDYIAVMNGVPTGCLGGFPRECRDCIFDEETCGEISLLEWLLEEHIEKLKLTKKERLFCELVETGWITRDKNGTIWWDGKRPTKRSLSWVGGGETLHVDAIAKFSFIKWEDEEPWSVEDLLKLEVE